MLTFTANDAKTRLGELLDRVQREPVQVARRILRAARLHVAEANRHRKSPATAGLLVSGNRPALRSPGLKPQVKARGHPISLPLGSFFPIRSGR